MCLSAAYALVSELDVYERDEASERRALEGLAAWAYQFSAFVSVVAPHSLLLEVQGSARLFGGLDALLKRIERELQALGYFACLAVAPTPTAATWLARAGITTRVLRYESLPSVLFELPLRYLDLTPDQCTLLKGIGIDTLGGCMRLPRDGLVRRLGSIWVSAVDRALGRGSDPRLPYVPPMNFESRIELLGTIDNPEGLRFPLNRLIQQLCGVLTARVAGVSAVTLTLHHRNLGRTSIELGLVAPTRDAKHLLDLFHERLSGIASFGPVEALTVSTSAISTFEGSNKDFFVRHSSTTEVSAELIERLRARLGQDAVRGLQLAADLHPEKASWNADPRKSVNLVVTNERPLWLLQEPVALPSRDGQPYWYGTLTLQEDYGRIKSGWLDQDDIARDYCTALSRWGERLWVFQEHDSREWWLHGVFG